MKNYISLIALFLLLTPIFGLAQQTDSQKEVAPKFTNSTDGLHYAIIRYAPIKLNQTGKVEQTDQSKQEQRRKALSQLNLNNKKSDLRLSQIYLSGKEKVEPVITVRRFESYQEASNYCDFFERELKNFSEDEGIIEALPISQANYRVCLRTKSTTNYKTYYLKELSQ